jgi:hypothetical protein
MELTWEQVDVIRTIERHALEKSAIWAGSGFWDVLKDDLLTLYQKYYDIQPAIVEGWVFFALKDEHIAFRVVNALPPSPATTQNGEG